MKTLTSLATGALALGWSLSASTAGKGPDGYTPDRAALAASLPVHVVAFNERVLPQLSFEREDYPNDLVPVYYTPQFQNPVGLGTGESILLAGALGNTLGNALAKGMHYAVAKTRAQAAYRPLKLAQCDLPVAVPMQALVREAIARSAWGANAAPKPLSLEDGDLDDRIDADQPRQIFLASSSFSPDLTALVTSLDIAAFAPEGDTGRGWRKQPLWRDQLIVVSDPLPPLPDKSAADIERMVADEQARYAASGNEALVRKVNAEGRGASRADRQAAANGQRTHASKLREARQDEWSDNALAERRAQLWSQDQCASLRTAFDQSSAELARMLDALYAQRLPPRLSRRDKAGEDEVAGERRVRALPGGVYVSRNEGGATELEYRYVLLPLKETAVSDAVDQER